VTGFRAIVFSMFCFVLSAHGQQDSSFMQNAGARALKKLGQNALKQNDPASAVFYLEGAVKKNTHDAEAKFLLASAYMKVRDYQKSQRMFLNAYSTNANKAPEALYFHAQMQKSNGLYDSAGYNFKKFRKEYKGKNKVLKKQAAKELNYCDSVKKIVAIRNKVIVQHLDTSVNKVNVEAAPIAFDENTLVFSSYRTNTKEYIEEGKGADSKVRKLYQAKRKSNQWKFAGELEGPFNMEEDHTSNACLSADKKRLYFTRCKENFKGEMICAIYVSEKNGDSWSEPVRLPKEINTPKYTATMPALASDPVKGNEILFFVSNRKGKGKLDIWYTVYNLKKGTYKPPRNAGIKINTSQNELSPFFDNETRTLYFSSDGMGGLGGFDIYKAKGNGTKWEVPENLGTPYNSGADDIYFSISPNRKEGFFVSNRKGGYALKNSTCCDDIYTFKKTDYIKISLEGRVHEITDPFEFVNDAQIEIYIKDKESGEKYLVKTVRSEKDGKFRTDLEAGNDYYLLTKKDDFLGSSAEVSTKSIINSRILHEDLKLVKKPKSAVRIPNINYQTDKWELLTESQNVLDTTVLKLMLENPELIVEIQSHTDSKGSESYNIKLSQKRSESVVKYLVSKGIDPRRLRAKGYGESLPLVPNDNPDGTDNPSGRAKNRRTDFKIIGVIDSELINESEIN
jgi:OmpA-OmpF porin, OOP family